MAIAVEWEWRWKQCPRFSMNPAASTSRSVSFIVNAADSGGATATTSQDRERIPLVSRPVRRTIADDDRPGTSPIGSEALGSAESATEESEWGLIDYTVPVGSSFVEYKVSEKRPAPLQPPRDEVMQAVIGLIKCSPEELAEYAQGLVKDVKGGVQAWGQIFKQLEVRGARHRACELIQFLMHESQFDKIHVELAVRLLTQEGKLQTAKKLLDSRKGCRTRSLTSYCMLLHACSIRGLLEEAHAVFLDMREDGRKLGMAPCKIIFHVYLRQEKRLDDAIQVFEMMKLMGLRSDIKYFYNRLLCVLLEHGRLEAAQTLLQEMELAKIPLDVSSYVRWITALGEVKDVDGARRVFLQAKAETGHRHLYSALGGVYTKAGMVQETLELFYEVEAEGWENDPSLYNMVINLMGKRGTIEEMEIYLERMQEDGVGLNLVTYNTLLGAYTRQAYFDKAHAVVHEMAVKGFKPNAHSYHILLHSAAKREGVEAAAKLFEELRGDGFAPSHMSYGIFINIYGQQGRYEDAKRIWNQMLAENCKPDVICYTGLLNAYSRHGMYKEALYYFQEMEKAGITPDVKAYTTLLKAFAEVGLCKEAEDCYHRMLKEGLVPDDRIHALLVQAFIKADRLEDGLEYLQTVLEYTDTTSYLCRRIQTHYIEMRRAYLDQMGLGRYSEEAAILQ